MSTAHELNEGASAAQAAEKIVSENSGDCLTIVSEISGEKIVGKFGGSVASAAQTRGKDCLRKILCQKTCLTLLV